MGMSEPIFERVLHDIGHAEHDLQRGWDAFTSHLHHPRYHQPTATATPATEAPMSLVTTLEADFADVRAKVEEFATSKLPAAIEDAKKLEGNPVVDALLAAAHVPVNALSIVVDVLNGLAAIYPRPADAAPADPAMGQPAEPAPAA
jgi:hypothetical protein